MQSAREISPLPGGKRQRRFGALNALPENSSDGMAPTALCLQCGLCCNGVIFADVRLQPGDDAERLRALGLPLAPVSSRSAKTARAVAAASGTFTAAKFSQPCAALEGCRCKIYANRPNYCREFECALLKSVAQGHTGWEAALEVIQSARRRVEEVRSLLSQCGDTDEELPLAARFRRTARRIERQDLTEETAEVYSRLTLAVHDLNLLLADAFYPGSGSG